MLLILFGLPEAGKNFVGDILKEEFDFFYYDIDDDIPEELKEVVRQGEIIEEGMRNKFF